MSRSVLMVNDIASIGGGTNAMLDVSRALLGAGWSVHLASPAGALVERSSQLGVIWHPFEFTQRQLLSGRHRVPRPQALAMRAIEGRRLASLADDLEVDVLHTGALVPHLDVAVAGARFRRRLVWHINQVHPWFLFAAPLPAMIVGVSDAALAPGRWRRGATRRAVVVPNVVDVARFRPPSDAERVQARLALGLGDQLVVVTVARLEPLKGVDTLVRAVASSRARPTLVVVGDSTGYSGGDAHARYLERLARETGADVRFLGARSDVPSVLWAADVVALASRWEAFGLVLAEASASGLPVVASNVGGCPEVVQEGSTGLLVDPDDVAAFARSIDRLAFDPDERAEMGQRGRAFVSSRFDARGCSETLLSLYERVGGNG